MAYKSLPGDDLPATRECRSVVDALLELGGTPGVYGHFDQRLLTGKLGIGLSLVLTKNIKVSELYTTADSLCAFSMRVDLATTRRCCSHVAYIADTSLKMETAVASKGIADRWSVAPKRLRTIQSRKESREFPKSPETKAAIVFAWNGLLVHLPLGCIFC